MANDTGGEDSPARGWRTMDSAPELVAVRFSQAAEERSDQCAALRAFSIISPMAGAR